MEQLLLILLFSLLVLVVTLTLIIKSSNSSSRSSSTYIFPAPLPPGPSQLPIIGHLHHVLSGDPIPHISLRNLSSLHGPIMLLRLGQVNYTVISSREAAEEILRTHDLCFASRPEINRSRAMTYGFRDIAMAPYGPSWRLLRKICITELLTVKRVASFASIRNEAVSALVESIGAVAGRNVAVNLKQKLEETTNDIVTKAAFSRECRQGRKEEFLRLLRDMLSLSSGLDLGDLFPWLGFLDTVLGVKDRIEGHLRRLDAILDEIIGEHEARLRLMKSEGIDDGNFDLLDVLLRVRYEEQFDQSISVEHVKAVALELFFAGIDTTSSTMQWAMSELMRNPKAMEKVQREIRQVATMGGKRKLEEEDLNKLNYLKQVIKETLRLHPSLPLLLPRLCRETCQVQGFTVPAGTRVLVNVWALGRDSRYWDDPEEFLPERFDEKMVDFRGANFEFLPFGAGRRICPGMNFGLANVELTLANLLLCFDWDLPDGMKASNLDMSETIGSTSARKVDLCLLATTYTI
ncbi:premnaspirodiene oxygenase-like [Dendrobium catenatum]|uniref:Premnaspirodiene oxygenase n=1 Tax=Dendrobium catenatum TaxID=906689 RepID=A0A2I0VBW8_9ASPA|nr:premnaspirodiene oxygenase-like [Dendrobium catenatum]PKU60886.1 Premnaspirodiene oxygenase [Dendrobium catenatum]